ncbi:carbohydrate sulfotransferase 11-like [Ruditapes philippinarum]|uniref:carbohydrate sulfotransferase 11-like n=1 Tax=Ruditapes philippinarum TaxID=129788 RepID=UPI00295A98EC|nr:carbohydrate sulfotransferase 11-like [Ruditapes philippinarum]
MKMNFQKGVLIATYRVRFVLVMLVLVVSTHYYIESVFFDDGEISYTRMSPSQEHSMASVYQQVYNFEEIQARNTERMKFVKQQCYSSVQNLNENERYMHGNLSKDILRLLTTPNQSILYCRVSKAGSTYTLITLNQTFDCDYNCLVNSSQRIWVLPYEKKKIEIRNVYKFLFVREPYGRLFSTYSNKFYFPKGNWHPIGTTIARTFRENPSNDSLKFGHDVKFSEFIRFVVEEFEVGHKMDVHIRPMAATCDPCRYDFDFIGKLETMSSDFAYLKNEWKNRNIIKKSREDLGIKTNLFSAMNRLKFTLHRIKGSHIEIFNLYQRAWRYYQITAVISKHIGMPFSKNMTIKLREFKQKLEKAKQMSDVYNTTAVKAQRHEAMVQAYSTVPLKDLERLKTFVREDCLLFGYDESPAWLFDRTLSTNATNTFNYFIGLD